MPTASVGPAELEATTSVTSDWRNQRDPGDSSSFTLAHSEREPATQWGLFLS